MTSSTNPMNEQDESNLTRCRQAREHLHRYVEDELDSIRTRLVESHLMTCADCRQQVEELESERLWLMGEFLKRPPLSDRFAAKVVEQIEQTQEDRLRRHVHNLSLWIAAACLLFALGLTWAFVGQRGTDQPTVNPAVDPGLTWKGAIGDPVAPSGEDEASRPVLADDPSHLPPPRMPDRIAAVATPDYDLHRLFVNRMGKIVDTVSSPYLVPEEPCGPDLNDDGRTDGNDVTYTCMVHFSRPPPSVLAREEAAEGADCMDDLCL